MTYSFWAKSEYKFKENLPIFADEHVLNYKLWIFYWTFVVNAAKIQINGHLVPAGLTFNNI